MNRLCLRVRLRVALLATCAAFGVLIAGCGRGEPDPAEAPPSGEARSSDAAVELVRDALGRFRDPAQSSPAPRPADARLQAARAHMGARRWDEARAALEPLAADRAAPVAGEAAFLLGVVHQEQHRPALSLPLFEQVLEGGPAFPNAAQAFYFYGKALAELGRLEAARAAFEADRALFPESGDAWFQLALLDVEEGAPDAARGRFEEALALFKNARDLAKVHARLGDLALAADDLAEAERRYQTSVALFPHYEVYYKLSGVARRRGDEQSAENYLRLHVELRDRAGASGSTAPAPGATEPGPAQPRSGGD